jgi:hypothetical protein
MRLMKESRGPDEDEARSMLLSTGGTLEGFYLLLIDLLNDPPPVS